MHPAGHGDAAFFCIFYRIIYEIDEQLLHPVRVTGCLLYTSQLTIPFSPSIVTIAPDFRIFVACFASGLIVEEGGINSHAAIVGLSLDIPVILEAKRCV